MASERRTAGTQVAPLPAVGLRELRYFIALADEGSVRGAARSLGLRPTSLSAALARLEVAAGVELMTRTPEDVVPTSAGLALLRAARRLVRSFDEAFEAARRAAADARYPER